MKSPYPKISGDAWSLLIRYATSGKAKCFKCENIIKDGQDVFEHGGNIFHNYCSQSLEGRHKI